MTRLRIAGFPVAAIAARLAAPIGRVQARLDELAHHELVKEHRAAETPRERIAREKLARAIHRKRYLATPHGRANRLAEQRRRRSAPGYTQKKREWRRRRKAACPEVFQRRSRGYDKSPQGLRAARARGRSGRYAKARQMLALRLAEVDAEGLAALLADIKSGRTHGAIGKDWLIHPLDVGRIAIACGIRRCKRKTRYKWAARPLTADEIASCLVQRRMAA